MNHSMYSADRTTHLKVVAVALFAATALLLGQHRGQCWLQQQHVVAVGERGQGPRTDREGECSGCHHQQRRSAHAVRKFQPDAPGTEIVATPPNAQRDFARSHPQEDPK